MALIELQSVSKHRSQHGGVLDNISFSFAAGTICALVGANGAGKTTLIKAILNLTNIDEGSIHLNGIPHLDWRARVGVAYMPEQFRPPHYLRGGEFLRAMGRLVNIDHDDDEVMALCEQIALDPAALHATVRTYSKGMWQKLGLVSVFLCGEKLLVLDEPMSGLDVNARINLKAMLTRSRDAGWGILLTTHLLEDVETLCDHVAVIDAGALRFFGSPAELSAEHGGVNLEQAYLACIGSASSATTLNARAV